MTPLEGMRGGERTTVPPFSFMPGPQSRFPKGWSCPPHRPSTPSARSGLTKLRPTTREHLSHRDLGTPQPHITTGSPRVAPRKMSGFPGPAAVGGFCRKATHRQWAASACRPQAEASVCLPHPADPVRRKQDPVERRGGALCARAGQDSPPHRRGANNSCSVHVRTANQWPRGKK